MVTYAQNSMEAKPGEDAGKPQDVPPHVTFAAPGRVNVEPKKRTKMSRQSVRLLRRRSRVEPPPAATAEIVTTVSRKRKAEEELDRSMDVTKRRQQFQIQSQWTPISPHSAIQSTVLVPSEVVTIAPPPLATPSPTIHDQTQPSYTEVTSFRFKNYFTTPVSLRHSPLPSLQWADSQEVWQLMLRKEQKYVRDVALLTRHSQLQSRMRAILLDWIIEVCEVYRLHRETFYLAIDFIDRYLSVTREVQKQQLQLLGITSLFVAAKLEEIYPPKLTEFAYVTDGACTENEILEQELVILKALKWDLSPMTTNSWLNVFMQLMNMDRQSVEEKDNFVTPQYSAHQFIQIARLLDLCFLDTRCLQFSYSVLATSAVYHLSSEAVALSVSGYKLMDIMPCIAWMSPFAMTLREVGEVDLRFFKQIAPEDAHNIQTHTVDLRMLEKAQSREEQMVQSCRASPDYTQQQPEIPGIITPPHSKGKLRNYE